jgi:hypothetical protein
LEYGRARDMGKRTLYVLAQAVETGLLETATMPASSFDPLVRPVVKGSVRRAIRTARANTGVDAPDHVLRAAFVMRHPRAPAPIALDDVEAVRAAYAELSKPFVTRRRHFWFFSLGVFAAVLGALAAALVVYLAPTPEERFRKSPLGAALADPLSDYIVAMGRADMKAETENARQKVLTKAVKNQVGPAAYGALETALARARVAQLSEDEDVNAVMKPVFFALNELNAKLLAAHMPAFVGAYGRGAPGERSVWLTSYYAPYRADLAFEGGTMRVVRGRRLDGLNLSDYELWKDDSADWMLVATEQVEEEFVRTLLRPLARGGPLGHEPYADDDHSPSAELRKRAGALVAAEITAATKLTQADAAAVDDAIARRNTAAAELKARGFAIESSDRLQLPPNLERGLDRVRSSQPWAAEVLHMDDAIAPYRGAVAPAVDLLSALREEEFVVELLEQKRLQDTALASLAAERVDVPVLRGVASSLLSLLARPRSCPRLALWLVAGWAYEGRYASATHVTGALVLDAVFGQLGLPRRDQWEYEIPDGDNFASALRTALEKPPAEIQAAAGRAYAQVFGRGVPALVRTVLQ